MTKEERKQKFIQDGINKFGDIYDYSKVEPFLNKERDLVTIICPKHGEFQITPKQFLRSKYGCQKCGYEHRNPIRKEHQISKTIDLPEIPILENPIIVSKDKIIGTVYLFVNKINHKLYVGETVKSNYTNRFVEHKNRAKATSNLYFYKAINKYGWDNFDKYVLFQTDILNNTPENCNILNDIVNEKEKYYIKLWDTTNHSRGYNLTTGGDGVLGYKFSEESKKKMSEIRQGENHWNYGNRNGSKSEIILQFDLNFNFIKEWPSMAEIGRNLGYKPNNVSRCCSNKSDSYMGYIWVKKEDYYEGYLQKYKSRAKCKSNDKTVLQYDFLGNYINEYISCAEAGKAIGKTTVSHGASGRDPQVGNFIWIYKKEFSENLLQDKLEKVKSCRFYKKVIENLQKSKI